MNQISAGGDGSNKNLNKLLQSNPVLKLLRKQTFQPGMFSNSSAANATDPSNKATRDSMAVDMVQQSAPSTAV